jgi:hypothetical protein
MPAARNIHHAVREVCLSFPEAEEFESHGSPNFRVRGKTFATYVVNHHGDGRVALWLPAADGVQDHLVHTDPAHFFTPPYVGPRGWVGVSLDKGLSWNRIADLVRTSYERVAPRAVVATLGKTIRIRQPVRALSPEEVDPWQARKAAALLKRLRAMCLAWPETSEDTQFGSPVFRVGKKVFVTAWAKAKQVQLHFRIGVERQGMHVRDARFSIPPYTGHIGWIALDVAERVDWNEVRELAFESYRHFAPRRLTEGSKHVRA